MGHTYRVPTIIGNRASRDVQRIQRRMTGCSRRAVPHDPVAEQANLGVASDIDGFVFAQFGFGGDEQGSVIYVRAGGVAGEEDEIGVAVAPGFEQEGTERTEISFSVTSVCSCWFCLRCFHKFECTS